MERVDRSGASPRRITGRTVFLALLAFFGVVILVNFIMARYAISTFAGLETESSYKAGLAFTKERAAADAQDARRWKVDVNLQSGDGPHRVVQVQVRDQDGQPLSMLVADGRFSHPTDARRDVVLDLEPLADGRYKATADAGAGQWDLVIDFSQNGERVFRSRNRVHLP